MVVLTSRRAVLVGAEARPGRLRLSERSLRFEPLEGDGLAIPLADVRRVALRRRVLVVEHAGGEVRLRCFGVRGVAGLLVQACARR
ncbi:hypothetical protein [Amnibacterium endophyticum]|uniref:Uncharacterized protein n=1 Tax=Amnibacterium endophyticum TaxID=2109337 RepID=A0ABW4LGT4_9MICO